MMERYVQGFWSSELYCRVSLGYSLILLFSIINIYTLNNNKLRESFLKDRRNLSVWGRSRLVFVSPMLWIDIAGMSVLACIAPMTLMRTELAKGLFGAENISKAAVIACVLPAFLLVTVISYLMTVNWWVITYRKQKKKHEKKPVVSLIKQLAVAVPMYLLAAFGLSVVYPAIYSTFLIIKAFIFALLITLICIVLGFIIYKYGRALIKRTVFIKELRTACKERGYELSKIKAPYLSIFTVCDGENFVLTTSDGIYSCKFIACFRRRTPLFFAEDGTASYMTDNLFFSHTVVHNYFFEGEGRKLLIVNPVAKNIFATDGISNRPLDVGDKVTDYYVYNGTGFLNAIKRNCLNR